MEIGLLFERLNKTGFIGAVKICLEKGRVNQIVESSARAGDGSVYLANVQAACDLIKAAELARVSGYVVIYFEVQSIRATFARVRTLADDDSVHFESAYVKGGRVLRAKKLTKDNAQAR